MVHDFGIEEFNQNIRNAIERLANITDLVCLESEEDRREDLQALSWAVVALSDMQNGGWTSVFDGLPAYPENCIVYTQDNRCCGAYLSEVDDKWYDADDNEVSAVWWREMLPYPPDTPYED